MQGERKDGKLSAMARAYKECKDEYLIYVG